MKKWYYVLLLLLLCVTFTACGTKSTRFPRAIKSEIEEAWQKEMGKELNLDYGPYGYYGTYDGAVAFFSYGPTDRMWKISVAGIDFEWGSGANLWVYKEGIFYSLEEAYELKLLTEQNIKLISEYHERFRAEEGY